MADDPTPPRGPGSEWSDKRLEDKFDAYDDAIKGLAALPMHAARLTEKLDALTTSFQEFKAEVRQALDEQREEQRTAIEQQQSRRTVVVAAVIGAFATIAAACIAALVVLVQAHP